ncbi:MAG: hypothetical protein IPL79_05105 [Myxococcales bacterium]|nr:hypothetical protein [Myxococcales bacterium]
MKPAIFRMSSTRPGFFRVAAMGLALFSLQLVWPAPSALAQRSPEKVFGGQVLLSDKRFPTADKSVARFISRVKVNQKKSIWEDPATQEWSVHMLAFFKQGMPDLKYTVHVFDITERTRRLVSSMDQYAGDRGLMSLSTSLVLARKDLGANRKIMITITSGGKTLATGRINLLGKVIRKDGVVDFSDAATQQASQ